MSLLQVMNEVVIDRGPSPYITNLEVFCNGRMITTVQADGKHSNYEMQILHFHLQTMLNFVSKLPHSYPYTIYG